MKVALRGFAAAVALSVVASVSAAEAATLSFKLTDTQGSASSDTDVVLEDVAGGVKFTYTVNDPANTADLASVFFNVSGVTPALSLANIANDAGAVTGVFLNTNGTGPNGLGGNIGQTFDIAIKIGELGSGGDFFSSFVFTILASGLDVSDFLGQTFAVRGQTVRPPNSTGGGSSSKEFGVAPGTPDNVVPLPAAAWFLLTGLGGLMAAGRRSAV
ncbi:MAG: VPLPA-CTERM sorting domain-containing protein [Alphaproteobacteria bacterium]|nr:VPLPA-CTERM sorting domain-containing protein [Alphaproteobacteria bacterium]